MRFSFSDFARLVLDVCRLRGGPQDFPYAPKQLLILIGASIALDGLIGGALGDAASALADSALSAGVVLALCALALRVRGLGNRYVQTALALFASGLLFSFVQGATAWFAGPAPPEAAPADGLRLVLDVVLLGLFAWGIVVYAHIMRQALNASFGLALALVVSWVLAYWALDHALLANAA